MPRFKPDNHNQIPMVVIHYYNLLQPSTFEHAVCYLIEHKSNLSVFHAKCRNDAPSRLAV
ncbi:transposase [Vreelandella sp. V005]|uniref:transposase n=1 Tax=Vreelandella sp. V005 TaxID=3459608 RepID=UPI004044AA28